MVDEFCREYPHNLIPTPGYWIECSRQKINMGNFWPPENDVDQDDSEPKNGSRSGPSDAHLERGCSDLYEDDEDSEGAPRYLFMIHSLNHFHFHIYVFRNYLALKQLAKENGNRRAVGSTARF